MLKFDKVCKHYQGVSVLKDISFEVPRGAIALFLGSSGVGKSTLLRVLCNLETIDSGSIFFNDKPIDVGTLWQQHLIGMVFQHFNLFSHLTVEENITLPLEKVLGKNHQQACDKARDLLDQFDLLAKRNSSTHALSGGQKQRLALARTLAMDPQIICLDEPTSALDPLLTRFVAQTIQDLASRGYSMLIATHDTTLLEQLDCMIYLMQNGRIVQSARSTDFRQNRAAYAQIKCFIEGVV
jgi:ABC-type polar amino acid transport system ATPase subunit